MPRRCPACKTGRSFHVDMEKVPLGKATPGVASTSPAAILTCIGCGWRGHEIELLAALVRLLLDEAAA